MPRKLTTAKARSMSAARKTRAGGHQGGRRRTDEPRCACGAMTLKCAAARRHVCGPVLYVDKEYMEVVQFGPDGLEVTFRKETP